MAYRHRWGVPSLVVVTSAARPVNTVQQACERCGTSRNPLTRGIIRFRKAPYCQDVQGDEPPKDYSTTLARLKTQLDALEADGYDVDREYGRKPNKQGPELPLAYKD